MFEITSFLLKHLYEMMADNYIYQHHHHQADATAAPMSETLAVSSVCGVAAVSASAAASQLKRQSTSSTSRRRQRIKRRGKRMRQAYDDNEDTASIDNHESGAELEAEAADSATENSNDPTRNGQSLDLLLRLSREQETNQQIISFLTNNQLPDLACDTFIELLFICVFLAFSWIFVMIIQLHFNSFSDLHPQQQSAKNFYCNTQLLASLMYCYNKGPNQLAY